MRTLKKIVKVTEMVTIRVLFARHSFQLTNDVGAVYPITECQTFSQRNEEFQEAGDKRNKGMGVEGGETGRML